MKRNTILPSWLILILCLLLMKPALADVTYTTEPVAAGNVAQGSNNNIVYIAKVDVTTLPVTITGMSFTLTGTHDNNDLQNYRIFSNTTPSLTGATQITSNSALFAAPTTYNPNLGSQAIAAGATRYFIVTVDITAGGTNGNTVKMNGATNPVTFTYTTAPLITNNQTDVTGITTIQAAGVTISSEAVTGGNVAQGSNNNIVYIAKVDVTTLPVTITGMSFTLTGTHDNNDLQNYRIFSNTTPSLTGATQITSNSALFAAPTTYNPNLGSQAIAAGATRYFIVTVDITAGGTNGNTVKMNGATNPVTFTYTTAPLITNNQTDVTGITTIQAAGVTISSEAVTGGNVAQGSNNNIVYIAKVDVTTLPVTITGMSFTLTGTHDNNDLQNYRIFSNTTPSLTGATQITSNSALFAAPTTYNPNLGSQAIAAGTTRYFIVTVDITAGGTNGNTVKLNGATNPVTFTYTTAPPITNSQTDAAGIKTITTTLPLTLVSFTAATSRQQTQLHWTTEGEVNTKSFEVEWGIDGLQFAPVASLPAAGNSLQQKQYSYLHKLPAQGVNFYRLKMTDRDGRFTYSPIAKLVQNLTKAKAVATPNPVADVLQLTVQTVANETVQLRIVNTAGIQVAVKNMVLASGTNRLYWNLQQLTAGTYYITPNNGLFETIKIIKIK